MAGRKFLDIIEVALGVVVDHHVNTGEGLQEVLLHPSTRSPHPLEQIGTHAQLTRKHLGDNSGLAIRGGVQHKAWGGEEHFGNALM